MGWWREGKLRPHVSATYPLERASEAIANSPIARPKARSWSPSSSRAASGAAHGVRGGGNRLEHAAEPVGLGSRLLNLATAVNSSAAPEVFGSSISTRHVVGSGWPWHENPSAASSVPVATNGPPPVSSSNGESPTRAAHEVGLHVMSRLIRTPRALKPLQSVSDNPMQSSGGPTRNHFPSSERTPLTTCGPDKTTTWMMTTSRCSRRRPSTCRRLHGSPAPRQGRRAGPQRPAPGTSHAGRPRRRRRPGAVGTNGGGAAAGATAGRHRRGRHGRGRHRRPHDHRREACRAERDGVLGCASTASGRPNRCDSTCDT